ncbi:hypothetical protein [Tropicimonas sp. S265A]|uniref:hypothetical protein n=1 Tax=Tropicimonas sp. S265A TaxID=3415134 RepID=UPI003C7BF853
MGKFRILFVVFAALSLAACNMSNDGRNAAIGAGVGAAGSLLTDGNPLAGAAVGAAAGALCDDVGVCN